MSDSVSLGAHIVLVTEEVAWVAWTLYLAHGVDHLQHEPWTGRRLLDQLHRSLVPYSQMYRRQEVDIEGGKV